MHLRYVPKNGEVRLKLPERLRKPGGGRKRVADREPSLLSDLEEIMEESTAGDPMSLLKWTYKSTYAIAEELRLKSHKVSHDTVRRLLKESGYSLQANRKTLECKTGPERDTQFRYINSQAAKFIDAGDPVISVDAKKKELVGNYKNSGRTWRQKGQPELVNVYDFPSKAIGAAIPYGIYDLKRNDGVVNIGKSHNTAEFAVALMEVVATEAEIKDGSSFCSNWLMKLELSSLLVIFHLGRASGIRSSIACSHL